LIKEEKGDDAAVFGYRCDLADREEVYAMAERVKAERGPVTMLINNAGIVSGTSLLDTSDDDVEQTFRVNIMAHFWTVKAFLPDMISQKKGHVVNVASMAGHSGISRLVDYCSSKYAAVGFDEALREELVALGHSDYVKTTVVCPYFINTGMFDGVESKVLSVLDPQVVADRVVEGILTDSVTVFVPRWITLLMLVKALVTAKGYGRLAAAIRVSQSMDNFTGRTTTKDMPKDILPV
jgi:all-trans-retinol dehydrogenase (NAD+)